MGENLCQLFIRQGTDNQKYAWCSKTKLPPKINDPVKKWVNEMDRAFSTEEVQITKKHMKKCLQSLAIKEMQIKTTLRFHLTPVRMTTIKNTNNSKCWQGCREKGALIHCWWECKLVQPLWKTVWRCLKEL
jgi:hypothetical protein